MSYGKETAFHNASQKCQNRVENGSPFSLHFQSDNNAVQSGGIGYLVSVMIPTAVMIVDTVASIQSNMSTCWS